jgi:hypothetical protein
VALGKTTGRDRCKKDFSPPQANFQSRCLNDCRRKITDTATRNIEIKFAFTAGLVFLCAARTIGADDQANHLC